MYKDLLSERPILRSLLDLMTKRVEIEKLTHLILIVAKKWIRNIYPAVITHYMALSMGCYNVGPRDNTNILQ
ncbi:hypothetical protein HS1genome_0587 [Sulfodiicoccus acidiphilus]|uniref:Uncharacterized protein n=2 Tax=Sulfodiicoccus acidiphilus TaxID=1670455 RepID=A0A348B1Z6_9CREN|nr:hypothetical protein HS1genome_0587 [Sulfodiicoccus acidiphilus]